MGIKIVLVATVVAAAAVGLGGYWAMKQPHKYDPRIEAVLDQETEVAYRTSGTTGAGTEYQITHLLVTVPGAQTAEQGIEQLISRLRDRGWRIDRSGGATGYSAVPTDVKSAAAVFIEIYADVLRENPLDLTGTYDELKRHAGNRDDLILVIVEAQE